MKNVGVSGTTQYEAMVQQAVDHMVDAPPDLDVEAVAAAAGVPRDVALKLFPDSVALCTAAAENALVRLVDHIGTRSAQEPGNDPVAQFRAVCISYLEWSIAHPRAFEVLNSRSVFRQSRSGSTERYNRAIRDLTMSLLSRANEAGRLKPGTDLDEVLFRIRALVNGMATLVVHRLAAHWTDADDVAEAALKNVNSYLDGLFVPAADQAHGAEPAARPPRK